MAGGEVESVETCFTEVEDDLLDLIQKVVDLAEGFEAEGDRFDVVFHARAIQSLVFARPMRRALEIVADRDVQAKSGEPEGGA